MATGIMIGLAVASAGMQLKNAQAQAKAVVQQGANEATRAKQITMARAAEQKSSFLSSGITLEGTPLSVMNSTYDVGKADIEQGIRNANVQSRNIIGASRANALSSIAMSVASAGFGAAGADSTLTSTGIAPFAPRKPF